jgi:pathogenesis-related protein 1
MNGKLSIIIIMILVTAAILTVQSTPSSSMLQPSYAQSCPEGSPVDASGNCATLPPPPPADDGETTQAQSCPEGSPVDASGNCATLPPPPPADDGETAAQAPPATETPPPAAIPPPATNTGTMSADWANSVLAVHNSERAAVGVPPLVWSDSLATSAQTWAEHLATIPEMVHSGPGENIAGFFTDPTEPRGGTSLWVAEKQNWHGGVLTEENWYPTGHYTQMVWRSTTDVGCGVSPPGAGGLPYSILVCVYYLPGNFIGQAPY